MNLQEFSQRYSYDERRDRLGKGGFGSVFKAYDNVLDRYVAIKIAQVDPDYDNLRLSHEVEKAARLEHVNVAHYDKCMSFKTLTGEVDIAIMQYYENGSLSCIIDDSSLDAEHRYDLLTQILEGIAYLHSEGIIHRDLKPQNVLIARRGDRYIPKITDFGISKQLDDGQSSAVSNSVLGGTRSYASPEQLKDSTIRKNTDLWSFGVIAFQMLVGKLPFDCGKDSVTSEEGRLELFRQMTSGVLPEALNDVPEPWQRLIRECLTVDNEKRIAHAEDCLAIIRGGDATAVEGNSTEVDPEPIAIPVEAVEAIPTPKPAPQPTPKPKVEPTPASKPQPKSEVKAKSKEQTKPAYRSVIQQEPKKKRSKWWLWLLLLAIVGGGVFAYLSSQPKDNPKPTDEPEVIVPDTIEEVDSVEVAAPIEEVDSVEVVVPIVDPEPEPILSLSKREINVPYRRTNGDIGYTVENPIDGVSVRVSENEDWLFTSVDEDIIRYTVTQNDLYEQRSTTFTVSYGSQSFEVAITQNGKPAGIYAVGDYYNEDGVEGVVFEISDGGRHGKIVSVDQARVSWGPFGADAPADSETDGKANTDDIMILANIDSYPAFTWCRDKGLNWYLPAKNELLTISLYRDTINATLRERGYTEISRGWHWSSTEYNKVSAWRVDMGGGYTSYNTKGNLYYVRAVSAF